MVEMQKEEDEEEDKINKKISYFIWVVVSNFIVYLIVPRNELYLAKSEL